MNQEALTMTRILAACGNDCSACPRFTAPPYEKTPEELRHTAELWMKIGYRDHVVTNGEIACSGCKPENRCRFHITACCEDKGIATCADCADYPCDRTEDCLAVTASFEPGCREACTQEEYEQLQKAFFRKRQNLDDRASSRTRPDP